MVAFMKTLFRSLLVAALLLASARASSANAIVNGSFEAPDLGVNWQIFTSIPGWVGDEIEIGHFSFYAINGPLDGDQVMELDPNHNATVNTDSLLVTPGTTYDLSFYYAGRGYAGSLATSTFDVYWNNLIVPLASFAPLNNTMTLYTAQVVAGATNTLTFKGTGASDSYGALIDNVQLNDLVVNPNAVPDGGLTSALLGLSIVGLGVVRRIIR